MKTTITLLLTFTMAVFAMAIPTDHENQNTFVDHGIAVDQLMQDSQAAAFDHGNHYDYRLHYSGTSNDRHVGDPSTSRHGVHQIAYSEVDSYTYRAPIESCNIDIEASGQHFTSGMHNGLIDQHYTTATGNDHQITGNYDAKRENAYRQRTLHPCFVKAPYMDWRTGSRSDSWRHSNSLLKTKVAVKYI